MANLKKVLREINSKSTSSKSTKEDEDNEDYNNDYERKLAAELKTVSMKIAKKSLLKLFGDLEHLSDIVNEVATAYGFDYDDAVDAATAACRQYIEKFKTLLK